MRKIGIVMVILMILLMFIKNAEASTFVKVQTRVLTVKTVEDVNRWIELYESDTCIIIAIRPITYGYNGRNTKYLIEYKVKKGE